MIYTYHMPFKVGDSIIELGGGATPVFRPNLDLSPGPTVDIVSSLADPLPLNSSDFDAVYCSYAIEHISWRKVQDFIKEVYRILKPNGTALFVTANLREQARALVNNEVWTLNESCMVFGGQDYLPGNSHLCGFSPEFICELMNEGGFRDVIVCPHPNCVTDMIIEVRK